MDASIYGDEVSDFTDNGIQLFYYEEPEYKEISTDESPANIEDEVFIVTDFKRNPIERLKKYANISCRFRGEDGTMKYTQG